MLLDVAWSQAQTNTKETKSKEKKHFFKFFSLRSANLTFDVRDPFAAETKTDRKPCEPHVFGTALLESGVWKRRRLALCWRDASKVWRRGGLVLMNWNRSSSTWKMMNDAKIEKTFLWEDQLSREIGDAVDFRSHMRVGIQGRSRSLSSTVHQFFPTGSDD